MQDDPGLIDSAVEEFLRYDSPVQITDRIATQDTEVAGVPVKKGQIVVTLLRRLPDFTCDIARLDWGKSIVLRGPSALWLQTR